MGVYYNRNKKIFIESEILADVLETKGYKEINILELKVGEDKDKSLWILKDDSEFISEYGVYTTRYCEQVTEKKVESLNEIRAYFAYLKRFITLSLPKIGNGYYMRSVKLESMSLDSVPNYFGESLAFESLIPCISYNDFLENENNWIKENSLELVIPQYKCTSTVNSRYNSYEYTYLYYPFISLMVSLSVCPTYSLKPDERLRNYNWRIEELPMIVNHKYSFYDITGLSLEDIDFEDIYGSVVALNSAKKNFEYMISTNTKELEELRKRMVKEVAKEFKNEMVANEETRRKYADDIDKLIQKMDMLAEDSRFADLKEEFFKEIGVTTQSNYLEFKKKLEQAISDIDDKRQEIISLNRQLTEMISRTKKQIDEEISLIIQSGNESLDKAKNSFSELEKRREQLVKDITEEVVREVIKRNPVQEINIQLGDEDIKRKVRGIYHESFKEVLQLIYLRTPVFLVGPAGCGKNVMLKQAAKVLDLQFYYINDAREKYDLLGFVDANGKYQETQFFKAFTKGGLLMIDELDSADASVLLLLNSALGTGDDFYMTFPDGNQYQAHPNFHLVAAANTFGTGANQTYNGRNQLDGASLNRFLAVEVDYDTNIERALVNNPEILPLYWEVRRIIRENEINYVVSTRNILNADKYLSAKAFSLDKIFKWTLVSSMTEFDLGVIISNIKTTDKYSVAFIDFVKKNYKIQEAKEKTRTRTRENSGYSGSYEDYGNYGYGRRGYV